MLGAVGARAALLLESLFRQFELRDCMLQEIEKNGGQPGRAHIVLSSHRANPGALSEEGIDRPRGGVEIWRFLD